MRWVLLFFAWGCGVPQGVLTPETAAHIDAHQVEWNPKHERIEAVTGALDVGNDVVVFTRGGTAIIADGAVTVTHDALRPGGIIPAPDGSGSWVTALGAHGRVYRLRARHVFEPPAVRHGLEGKDVHAVAGLGGRRVAFALDHDLAIAYGDDIVHFDVPNLTALAAGGSRAWLAGKSDLVVVDAETRASRVYAIDDPHVAVDGTGHVYVASGRAVYEEKNGALALRYVAHDPVRSLVASSDHVWFADGGELGVIRGAEVSRTQGAKVDPRATLMGSPSGDVWAIDGRGELTRWAIGAPANRTSWKDLVAPVFARACAGCHGPDGSSGVDLSTEDAWRTKRDTLRRRLVRDHDMPPQGHVLSDTDRHALGSWIDAR